MWLGMPEIKGIEIDKSLFTQFTEIKKFLKKLKH